MCEEMGVPGRVAATARSSDACRCDATSAARDSDACTRVDCLPILSLSKLVSTGKTDFLGQNKEIKMGSDYNAFLATEVLSDENLVRFRRPLHVEIIANDRR